MKRTLSLFLTLVMALGILTSVPVTVSAASVDDLTFELNEDGKSYSVTKCDKSASGEIVIPAEYNGLPVSYIGSYSFRDCKKITGITIYANITQLDAAAFVGCEKLSKIDLPSTLKQIYTLTEIEKPFESTLFYKDANNWENGALYLNNILVRVKENHVADEYIVKEDTISIVEYCFSGCENIKKIILSEIVYIGANAFNGCTNLIEVNIPETITHIPEFTFAKCDSLETVVLPEGVKTIGKSAFSKCSSLKKVIIPRSVTSVSDYSFLGCEKLKDITILGDCSIINWYYPFGYIWNIETSSYEKLEGVIIRGLSGSESEIYAKENGFTFIEICEHKTTKWITDKKATVNKAGKNHKECTECGEVLETAEIPQLKCSKPKLKKIENTSGGVKITWGKVTGADKYYVYRKVKGGSYSKIGTTTKTYYTDKKAKSGKKYYYVVKAVNEAGKSDSTSSKSIYYLADTTLKTPKSTKSGVTLNWTQITGADGYMVYRKTGSGDYKKIATVKCVKKVKYTDKSAKKGKTYTYKVKAYYSKTYSAYSNAKKIKDKY